MRRSSTDIATARLDAGPGALCEFVVVQDRQPGARSDIQFTDDLNERTTIAFFSRQVLNPVTVGTAFYSISKTLDTARE